MGKKKISKTKIKNKNKNVIYIKIDNSKKTIKRNYEKREKRPYQATLPAINIQNPGKTNENQHLVNLLYKFMLIHLLK